MTTTYKFKAGYTRAGVEATPTVAPTITIVDDGNNILVNAAATTGLSNLAGVYLYSYSGADSLVLVGVFHTTDTTVDQQDLFSTPILYLPTTSITQVAVSSNLYCTLADLKSSDVLNTPATAGDDNFLTAVISAVSRAIDNETARHFYQSAAHEIRYFTAVDQYRCFVGDIVSVTALYTDSASGDRSYPFTWASTDYDLWPYDAATPSEPEPYRFIDVAPRGLYLFPIGTHNRPLAKGVKLDAVFGWPEVPAAIAKACLLWSERTFKRYKTPLGVESATPFGTQSIRVPPPDPDVQAILSNYRAVAV